MTKSSWLRARRPGRGEFTKSVAAWLREKNLERMAARKAKRAGTSDRSTHGDKERQDGE